MGKKTYPVPSMVDGWYKSPYGNKGISFTCVKKYAATFTVPAKTPTMRTDAEIRAYYTEHVGQVGY